MMNHETTLQFYGVTLLVQSDLPHLCDWLREFYEDAVVGDSDSSGSAGVISLRITCRQSLATAPLTVLQQKTFLEMSIAGAPLYYGDGIFQAQSDGEYALSLEFDQNGRELVLVLGSYFAESQESFIFWLFRDILRKLICPFNNMMILHGAVVAGDGRALFLSGDGGAGKTTAALFMVQSGYKIISDDSPIATLNADGTVSILSSLDGFSISENTLNLLPGLRSIKGSKREISGKFLLKRSALGPDRVSNGPVKITHFVELHRGAYESAKLLPESGRAAAGRVIDDALLLVRREKSLQHISVRMFQTATSLLAHSRAFRFEYANEDVDKLSRLIEKADCQ